MYILIFYVNKYETERDALCPVLARQNESDKITGHSPNQRLKPACSGT